MLLCISAFSFQPSDERKAQEALPHSNHPLWEILSKSKVHFDKKAGLFTLDTPPEVMALNGQEITISGFMLPLDTTEKHTHFILAKRTPTCPFCPPGGPGEMIEVHSKTPFEWNEDALTLTGKFSILKDPQRQLGLFFHLDVQGENYTMGELIGYGVLILLFISLGIYYFPKRKKTIIKD